MTWVRVQKLKKYHCIYGTRRKDWRINTQCWRHDCGRPGTRHKKCGVYNKKLSAVLIINRWVPWLSKTTYMFMRRLWFGKRLNCLFSFVQLMATDTYLLCRSILLRTPWNQYPRELLFEYPPPHHFKEFELSLVLKSMPLQITNFPLPSCVALRISQCQLWTP